MEIYTRVQALNHLIKLFQKMKLPSIGEHGEKNDRTQAQSQIIIHLHLQALLRISSVWFILWLVMLALKIEWNGDSHEFDDTTINRLNADAFEFFNGATH